MAGIKDSLSKGFATVNVKSSNLMEKNKIKTYISTLEKEIADLELKAGQMAYNSWKQGGINVDGLGPIMETIDKKQSEIISQKEHSLELDRMEQQILGTPATDTNTYIFCSSCGTKNMQGNKFCTKCGTPLQ